MTVRSTAPRTVILGALTALFAGCDSGEGSSASPSSPAGASGDPAAPAAHGGHAGSGTLPSGSAGSGVSPSGSAGSGASAGSGLPSESAGSAGEATRPPPSGRIDGQVTVIASTKLNRPTDLAWNPVVPDQLWVVNHGDSSATIVSAASTDARTIELRLDPEGARHFMPQPTAFAFGARETSIVDAQGERVEGTFATCPESAADYMGPTLWTSDLRIFAIAKADREPPFNGADTGGEGPGSHLDMLHRTPTCAGLAWEGSGHRYWTYSGGGSMLVKYDFGVDHGIGNTDHSDGSVWRYPLTGVRWVAGIPSHLAFDPASNRLYLADTGNGRVVVFDPASATQIEPMAPSENVDRLRVAQDLGGGQLRELVAPTYGLRKPSGIEVHAGALYVSDNETGIVHKFALDGAPLASAMITGVERASLAGLAFGPDDKLYLVDMVGDRILRLENPF